MSKRIAVNIIGTAFLAKASEPFNEQSFNNILQAFINQQFNVYIYSRSQSALSRALTLSLMRNLSPDVQIATLEEINALSIDYAIDHTANGLDGVKKVFLVNGKDDDDFKDAYLKIFRINETRFDPSGLSKGSQIVLLRHSFPWIHSWSDKAYRLIGNKFTVEQISAGASNPVIMCRDNNNEQYQFHLSDLIPAS
jgi:hypothetical protein